MAVHCRWSQRRQAAGAGRENPAGCQIGDVPIHLTSVQRAAPRGPRTRGVGEKHLQPSLTPPAELDTRGELCPPPPLPSELQKETLSTPGLLRPPERRCIANRPRKALLNHNAPAVSDEAETIPSHTRAAFISSG